MSDQAENGTVAVRQEQPPAITEGPGALLNVMLQLARDPDVRIEVLTALAEMQQRAEERQAEREFNTAMNAAQAEMQPIVRDAENKQTNSRYATLFKIDEAIRPIYIKHGFSPMFRY